MILLAGGTDGGNRDTIIHNAEMINKFNLSIPIVVAGNKSSNDEIIGILVVTSNIIY